MSKHFEEDDLFDRFAILSRAVEAGAEWLAGDLADVNKTIDRRLASFC
jgi:hypothetical protein